MADRFTVAMSPVSGWRQYPPLYAQTVLQVRLIELRLGLLLVFDNVEGNPAGAHKNDFRRFMSRLGQMAYTRGCTLT